MKKSNESAEDYLETILMLSKELEHIRSIDIVAKTGYKKSSISVAMKHLKEDNLIDISKEGYITLTKEGNDIALAIYERHLFISSILIKLGVNEKTALEDACRIEHYISEESFNAIKNHASSNKHQ